VFIVETEGMAIVDKKRRILWRVIGEKGSAHDSRVFNESELGKFMLENDKFFFQRGLYLIGDSAYSLRSYLLTPYDRAKPGSAEDTFNFYLSSNRISVECAFGMIDRRWGIFWKPLEGQLNNHKYTIDSALRLHNFIIDFNEANEKGEREYDAAEERRELDILSDQFAQANPDAATMMGPVVDVGGEEPQGQPTRGRPIRNEALERDRGKVVRDAIRDELHLNGFSRPRSRISMRDKHNREVGNGS
jgi:hypothetical protein